MNEFNDALKYFSLFSEKNSEEKRIDIKCKNLMYEDLTILQLEIANERLFVKTVEELDVEIITPIIATIDKYRTEIIKDNK